MTDRRTDRPSFHTNGAVAHVISFREEDVYDVCRMCVHATRWVRRCLVFSINAQCAERVYVGYVCEIVSMEGFVCAVLNVCVNVPRLDSKLAVDGLDGKCVASTMTELWNIHLAFTILYRGVHVSE